MNPIYLYTDYRLFLQHAYKKLKAKHPVMSLRNVARRIGVNSRSLFLQIMNGKSNVSPKIMSKLEQLFELTGCEAKYFEAMVHFSQSKQEGERCNALEEMYVLRSNNARKLGPEHFSFYGMWYYQTIWALIGHCRFSGNFEKLAQSLIPPIKTREARAAIKLLEKIGLIKRNSRGIYKQCEAVLTSHEKAIETGALVSYQYQILERVKESIEGTPKDMREISTVTASISKKAYEEIKQCTYRCRKHIMEIARQSKKPDRVYQINMNIFPMSKCI